MKATVNPYIVRLVGCERVRQGEKVTDEFSLSWLAIHPAQLPVLGISTNFQVRKNAYKCSTCYTVEEVNGGPDGRAFILTKLQGELAEGEVATTYTVEIARNGQDHRCDCDGFRYHRRCKHCDALRFLLDEGIIGEPHAKPTSVAEMLEAPF